MSRKLYLDHYMKNCTKWLDGCLVYTLKLSNMGYARVNQNSGVKTEYGEQLLHRALWISYHGEIPNKMVIMHLCDNPACLNIKHLQLGTVADNNLDRDLKGRTKILKGVLNGTAKLTEDNVRLIREFKGEFSGHFLAPFFNVSPAAINSIWRGCTWRHVV